MIREFYWSLDPTDPVCHHPSMTFNTKSHIRIPNETNWQNMTSSLRS